MYIIHVTVGEVFISNQSQYKDLDDFFLHLKEHYPIVDEIQYNIVPNKKTAPMFTCRRHVTSDAESHLINNLIEDARDLFVMWLNS